MEETIAKRNNKSNQAEGDNMNEDNTEPVDNSAEGSESNGRPELPENMQGGGPMGGVMPGQMSTSMGTSSNEWLVPMSCAGVVSGIVVIATAVICYMLSRLEKKLKR